jgi:hypothetical protein
VGGRGVVRQMPRRFSRPSPRMIHNRSRPIPLVSRQAAVGSKVRLPNGSIVTVQAVLGVAPGCPPQQPLFARLVNNSIVAPVGLVFPSVAQVNVTECIEPIVPIMPNGRTAPAAAIIAAANAVKAYVVDSDAYQNCLKEEIDREDNPQVKADLSARGDANQASKERLDAAYAVTAAAYEAAHPPAH